MVNFLLLLPIVPGLGVEAGVHGGDEGVGGAGERCGGGGGGPGGRAGRGCGLILGRGHGWAPSGGVVGSRRTRGGGENRPHRREVQATFVRLHKKSRSRRTGVFGMIFGVDSQDPGGLRRF